MNPKLAFKKVWQSGQVWLNLVAVVAAFSLEHFGVEFSAVYQIAVLAALNIALRICVRLPIAFTPEGAYGVMARYIDRFQFKWRDVKHTKSTLNRMVWRAFRCPK